MFLVAITSAFRLALTKDCKNTTLARIRQLLRTSRGDLLQFLAPSSGHWNDAFFRSSIMLYVVLSRDPNSRLLPRCPPPRWERRQPRHVRHPSRERAQADRAPRVPPKISRSFLLISSRVLWQRNRSISRNPSLDLETPHPRTRVNPVFETWKNVTFLTPRHLFRVASGLESMVVASLCLCEKSSLLTPRYVRTSGGFGPMCRDSACAMTSPSAFVIRSCCNIY
jgi:hypothetical protein